MSLLSLTRLLPPPSRPAERPVLADWKRNEAEVGELPRDYQAFLDVYGTGLIDRFIWIYNPASQHKELNLVRVLAKLRTEFELAHQQIGTTPLLLYPEPGGLLPVGHTTNGDLIFWRTGGRPEQWRITVNPAREEEFLDSQLALVDWLGAILSRNLRSDAFPTDFPGTTHMFEPVQESK